MCSGPVKMYEFRRIFIMVACERVCVGGGSTDVCSVDKCGKTADAFGALGTSSRRMGGGLKKAGTSFFLSFGSVLEMILYLISLRHIT